MSSVLQFPTTFKGFRKARRPKALKLGVVTATGRIKPYDIVYEESEESARNRRIQERLDYILSKWVPSWTPSGSPEGAA